MLAAEVRPQIDNLPCAQPDQRHHDSSRKPLDALVRALVGIPQLLFAPPEVLHLSDNLTNNLLNTLQFDLDGLELLGSLDSVPIAGVGANIDVELNLAGETGAGSYKPECQ